MTSKIGTADRAILRLLFAAPSGKIDIIELYTTTPCSLAQIARAANRLKWLGVITIDENQNFRVTEDGKIWILKNRKKLFMSKDMTTWRKAPIKYLSRQKNPGFSLRTKDIEKFFFPNGD